ncbi:MAG: penicillin-binding protein [Bacteroides sp.]|nr:penicillin-binding protein [Bacteroides sp.]
MMKRYLYLLLLCGLAGCQSTPRKAADASTIDNALQTAVTSALESTLLKLDAQCGQAIVMETRTGAIKAFTGLVRTDRADYLPWDAPDYELTESSLISPAYLLAALETGKVKLSDTIDVGNGIYSSTGREIKDHNWRRGGYGKITLEQGIAYGSDIAVCKAMERAFGNNADSIGNVKPAYPMATPLDVLTFYNALANKGKMLQPCSSGDSITVINTQIASAANIDGLRSALEKVVTGGLGKAVHSDKVQIAGKTSATHLADGKYAVEFCGYFPSEAPEYSMIVCIRKEGVPAFGGMAGMVVKQVAEHLIK